MYEMFFPLAFYVVWVGGLAILALRYLPKQRAYHQHFVWYDRTKAMWQRQADPELERLRRQIWRGYAYGGLWGVGFPLLTNGAMWLLVVVGLLHTP